MIMLFQLRSTGILLEGFLEHRVGFPRLVHCRSSQGKSQTIASFGNPSPVERDAPGLDLGSGEGRNILETGRGAVNGQNT